MHKLLWEWSPGLLHPLLCGAQEGCEVLRDHKTTFPVPSGLTNRWLYKRHSVAPMGCFWRSLAFFSRFCVRHSWMHQSTSGRLVIWGSYMAACWVLGLCQTAAGMENHGASAGVALGMLSSRTSIVLVQEGGSLETFRVKQTPGFWIASYDISSYLLYKCGIAPHFSSLWPWLYSRLCCLAEVWSLCFPIPLWHEVNDVSFLLPFTCRISLIISFHWVGALFSSVFVSCPVHGSLPPTAASKHYYNIMNINNMKMLLWKSSLKPSLLCFPET